MEKMKLSEILKNQTITNQFDFSGQCPDKDGHTVSFDIFDTAFFLMEINHNYFNRQAFVDPDNAFTDFLNIFTQWKHTRGLMYARIAYAYSLGYNPIENYSSIETHSGSDYIEHGKKTEREYSNDKIERTYNQDKVERTYTQDKVEHTYTQDKVKRTYTQDKETITYNNVEDANVNKKYGVNSGDAVPVSEDTNTRSGSEDHEHSGGYSDEHSGGYSDEHSGGYSDEHSGSYADEHSGGYTDENSGRDTTNYDSTIAKSGNIGVMTASQMIQSEYDGLKQDLANRALKEFLDRYTFYSEVVDLW